jgi:hypothetical protein
MINDAYDEAFMMHMRCISMLNTRGVTEAAVVSSIEGKARGSRRREARRLRWAGAASGVTALRPCTRATMRW